MIRYHASWILPISGPPIRDGWIAVDRGRIAAIGQGGDIRRASDRHLGSVAILPGLVNAHTHLELSHLRDRIPPAREFVGWIRQVVAAQREQADVLHGIEGAIAECVQSGTALVGDISNTLASFDPLARSPLGGVVFHELIRFKADDPEGFVRRACERIEACRESPHVRASLAAHAPYSVAPRVFQAIRRAMERFPLVPCSVHLAESTDEVEFVRSGAGAWRDFLTHVGAWDEAWTPPGVSPVQFLHEEGFLDARTLAVHGVQMTRDDLRRLSSAGATLVTCPRSNLRTGAGVPPVEEFYATDVRVAIGTDSLASTPDLSVFAELAALRSLAPSVPASRLLHSATAEGAHALGFGADYGTLDPGKRARLLAVSIPEALDDVEEYLVGGIRSDDITWVDERHG